MNILDLLQQDNFSMKRKASTGGGEYAGACPWCGGRDRFLCWPLKKNSGTYWCRGCGKSGDAIQYLREFQGLSYKAACGALGIIFDDTALKATRRRHRQPMWKASTLVPPPEIWQHRAHAIVATSVKVLMSDKGQQARMWLHNRGIEAKTIIDQRLGLLHNRYESHEAWGLEDNGKNIWIPSGIIIPIFRGGQIIRVRIRRWNPGDGGRYILVRGSSTVPLVIGDLPSFVVVESELDAFLISQIAGDLVTVIGLGAAQIRPDSEIHKRLSRAKTILLALDSDRAGAKESWGFWKKHYTQIKRWPVPQGKDPGEAFQKGKNLRLWIQAGITENNYMQGVQHEKEK